MLAEHPTWNVLDATKIQEYMRCPRRFFFNYVLGWEPEGASVDLVFGSAWHEAMEVLLEQGYTQDAVANAYLRFEALYREVFGPEMDLQLAPKIPSNAMRALARYITHWANDMQDYKVLHIEVAGSVLLAEDKPIFYKMDSIMEELATSMIFSMEHKTTKSVQGRWAQQWRQKFQCGVYTHVLYCLFPPERVLGVKINGVQLTDPPVMKNDGTPRKGARDIEFLRVPVRMSQDRMADWLDTAEFYYDWIQQEFENLSSCSADDQTMRAFPKCTESCGDFYGCPFLDYCTAHGNPLRLADKPPLGYTTRFWDPRSTQENAREVMNFGKEDLRR